MNMMGIYLGTIGIMIVIAYFFKLLSCYFIASAQSTDNKGTKDLKFQQYNNAWNKFVKRY
jgi:hypothetical protein